MGLVRYMSGEIMRRRGEGEGSDEEMKNTVRTVKVWVGRVNR